MRKRGFTLIELLVVVSIIALLIAILLPSLQRARMQGKRTVSAANMRTIGIGIEMYAGDYGGSFPETSHGVAATRSWIFTLRPYLGNVDEVRICPADPRGRQRLAADGCSYVLNEYVAVRPLDPFGQPLPDEPDFTVKHRLRRPGEAITVFVCADNYTMGPTGDHTHSRIWFQPAPSVPWDKIRDDIQPDRYHVGGASRNNTKGSSNYLYADGHVTSITAEALKALADDRVNFARPRQ